MDPKARDSYLKNSPDSRLFSRRVARIRQKGFHNEAVPGEGNELDAVAVYHVNPAGDPIVGLRPWGDGTIKYSRDATATNTKTYTVPVGKIWELKQIAAMLTTSANVGNRNIAIKIGNGANDITFSRYTAATAASQFGTILAQFGDGSFEPYTTVHVRLDLATSTANQSSTVAYPPTYLLAGYTVTIYDALNFDVTDTLISIIEYVEFDA